MANQSITVTGDAAVAAAVAMQIIVIKVQDVTRQKWYTWNNGAWDSNGAPHVQNGQPVYVAMYATNNGGSGTCTLFVGVSDTSQASLWLRGVTVSGGASVGAEWNGTMPASGNLVVNCEATP